MSMPEFPKNCPPIKLEDAIAMIISSIAAEELGLSHIINAEGEKIQYILGTLNGGCNGKATVKDVLAVNKSVKSLMDSVMQNQMLLKSKLECAAEMLDGCRPPIGPTGPTAPLIL